MAFDQSTRNRVQKFVAESRAILTEEFTRQLQSTYGMDPKTGTIADPETLTFLDNQGQQTALILRETLTHYQATIPGKSQKTRTCQALDRIIREQAFTVLNRLSALRMAGARGFLIESIANGYSSKGFQLYKNLAGTALGKTEQTVTGDTYRQYLFSLFDEFSGELPVLFDRYSIQGRLFPRESAFLALLDQINHFEIEHLWAEDETIGWIYQYFNSQEERKKMRAESQVPRNSRELAVRNQFFTPRYVVEFLTDNTLGRIWYEMTQGKTSLVDTCRYLIRRPNVIFLAEGEDAPDTDAEAHESLSQEELLKQPVYIPFRGLKDPRELRMLDPACGSMHFGLYAFDLFERIYEEAWQLESELGGDAFDRPEGMASLQAIYSGFDEFKKSIPKLIIEHNIHGVDIDPRAVQIAGLSLWQRAHRSWHQMGIKPGDRPMIRKSNIVCAEPMPGDKEILKEFTSKLHPPVLGQLVETIFDKMELAGEAGSLLKIEEEIASTISMAKDEFNKEILQSKKEKGFLPGMAPKRQPTLFDFAELPDDTNFWDTAEKRILDALENYANQAESDDAQKRLFAEDAAKGFAFIDLCRKKFDVVLMNPPFGEFTKQTRKILDNAYPDSSREFYAAFVERSRKLIETVGYLGTITSRTGFFIKTLNKWRKNCILPFGIFAFAELGEGVLDSALVGTAAYILGPNSLEKDISNSKSLFMRLPKNTTNSEGLAQIINLFLQNKLKESFYISSKLFYSIPNHSIAYWLPIKFLSVFEKLDLIEGNAATIKVGLQTGDDFRFVRTAWEIPINEISKQKNRLKWVPHAKGGENSPFYSDIHLLVNWENDGSEIREHKSSTIRNSQFYFSKGLTFPYRVFRFSPAILPSGCITGVTGMGIFPMNFSVEALVTALNTDYVNKFVSIWLGRIEMGSLYQAGTIQSIPFPTIDYEVDKQLAEIGKKQILLRIDLAKYLENTKYFYAPIISIKEKLKDIAQEFNQQLDNYKEKSLNLFFQANDIMGQLYGLKDQHDEFIHQYPKKESTFAHTLGISKIEKIEIATRIISYIIGVILGRWNIRLLLINNSEKIQNSYDTLPILSPGMLQNYYKNLPEDTDTLIDYPIHINWSGIIVEDSEISEDIVFQAQKIIAYIWKTKHSNIEQEICNALNINSLRQYFSKSAKFFNDHLRVYSKSRRQAPIYWPLQTPSGSYTLWVYYHRLTGQTLYTCTNDFVEPKLKSVTDDLNDLRSKSNRSSTEEKELAKLTDLEAELKDFRDELLRIAKFWKPNLNDGVQITAAPLWKLFQHRQWQKKLKATWEKLEKGDYDWAHLACSIWPERVLKKCHSDRSLAIAHDVEDDFWEEVEVPVIRRGKDTGKTKWEWQPRQLSETQLQDLIRRIIETGHSAG